MTDESFRLKDTKSWVSAVVAGRWLQCRMVLGKKLYLKTSDLVCYCCNFVEWFDLVRLMDGIDSQRVVYLQIR